MDFKEMNLRNQIDEYIHRMKYMHPFPVNVGFHTTNKDTCYTKTNAGKSVWNDLYKLFDIYISYKQIIDYYKEFDIQIKTLIEMAISHEAGHFILIGQMSYSDTELYSDPELLNIAQDIEINDRFHIPIGLHAVDYNLLPLKGWRWNYDQLKEKKDKSESQKCFEQSPFSEIDIENIRRVYNSSVYSALPEGFHGQDFASNGRNYDAKSEPLNKVFKPILEEIKRRSQDINKVHKTERSSYFRLNNRRPNKDIVFPGLEYSYESDRMNNIGYDVTPTVFLDVSTSMHELLPQIRAILKECYNNKIRVILYSGGLQKIQEVNGIPIYNFDMGGTNFGKSYNGFVNDFNHKQLKNIFVITDGLDHTLMSLDDQKLYRVDERWDNYKLIAYVISYSLDDDDIKEVNKISNYKN
jgi:hypothetical protein